MKSQKCFIQNIIEVNGVPYEEGMLQHFLEVTLLIESCGVLGEQVWCFGKDDWYIIKKEGYFFA